MPKWLLSSTSSFCRFFYCVVIFSFWKFQSWNNIKFPLIWRIILLHYFELRLKTFLKCSYKQLYEQGGKNSRHQGNSSSKYLSIVCSPGIALSRLKQRHLRIEWAQQIEYLSGKACKNHLPLWTVKKLERGKAIIDGSQIWQSPSRASISVD